MPEWRPIPTVVLPDGWEKRHNPIGYEGSDCIVYDETGQWAGSYGFVGVSHRSNPGASGRRGWQFRGRLYQSEQAAVDALVANHRRAS